jgi:hypothetical protein
MCNDGMLVSGVDPAHSGWQIKRAVPFQALCWYELPQIESVEGNTWAYRAEVTKGRKETA